MQRLLSVPSAFAFAIAGTSTALAHAHLTKSLPAAGSTVNVAPTDLTLWFNEDLEPEFCTVEIVDGAGARVYEGKAKVDAQDRKILHVTPKPLRPGRYEVTWHVVSVDTHATSGKFSCAVAP